MIALAFGSKTQIFKNSFLQQEEGETNAAVEEAQEAAGNAGEAVVNAINEVIA